MSDWDAVHNTLQALWNGMDLEMGTDLHMLPNPNYGKFWMGDTVIALVKAGKFPEYLVDEKVKRILYVMYKTKMIAGARKKGEYNTSAHQRIAAKIAEEGIVLLKNKNGILPLSRAKVKTIAVIGYNAARKQSMGGGSSQVRAFYEVTPLEGLQKNAGAGIKLIYAKGYDITRGTTANTALVSEAVQAASQADVVIYVGGWTHGYNYSVWADNAYDAEDVDKPDMQMPFGQDELVKAVIKANPKTIMVLMGGSAIDMTQWIDQAPAVIQNWYAGLEGGNALARIIFGDVNPSGKLPMTFPKKLEDHGSQALGEYPGDTTRSLLVHYLDDIYVGYRYYDTYKVEPLFPFGHGLSYTSFQYSNVRSTRSGKNVVVSFTLKNTGTVAGSEVAQLYVHQQSSSIPRPQKELKGFQKIFLKPGEMKTVTIVLNDEAFQYFNDAKGTWVIDGGNYDIMVGSSSRDIRLNSTIKL
jgi:beta-glucosidase